VSAAAAAGSTVAAAGSAAAKIREIIAAAFTPAQQQCTQLQHSGKHTVAAEAC
jgi:hypothetical protein